MLCTWGQTIPGWVLPGASLDINFVTGTAYCPGGGGLTDIITGTRASTEYGLWADGHYSSFGSGVPVITDLGFWSWQTATNIALWNRDLTNANWTKSNTTVALDQTGIDGHREQWDGHRSGDYIGLSLAHPRLVYQAHHGYGCGFGQSRRRHDLHRHKLKAFNERLVSHGSNRFRRAHPDRQPRDASDLSGLAADRAHDEGHPGNPGPDRPDFLQ